MALSNILNIVEDVWGRGHLFRSGRSVKRSMPRERKYIQTFADAPTVLVGQNLNHYHHHKERIHEKFNFPGIWAIIIIYNLNMKQVKRSYNYLRELRNNFPGLGKKRLYGFEHMLRSGMK